MRGIGNGGWLPDFASPFIYNPLPDFIKIGDNVERRGGVPDRFVFIRTTSPEGWEKFSEEVSKFHPTHKLKYYNTFVDQQGITQLTAILERLP